MRCCSICYGSKQLTYNHVASFEHMNNIRKLPSGYHLMTDKDIIKYLRSTGRNQSLAE
jgi:hypothetical protein